MMKTTLSLLCLLLVTHPAVATPILIDGSGTMNFRDGELIASIGGPREGRYDDGSPAWVSSLRSFIGGWFSDVYFNGSRYTYLYGIEAAVCIDCGSGYYGHGQSTLLEGEFSGHRPNGQWGRAGWSFAPLGMTEDGFTFTGYDAAVFYLLSEMPPTLSGLMRGHFEISNGYTHEDPLWGPNLFFTASMPVYVPDQQNPVPEPGTFALIAVAIGALVVRQTRAKSRV